MRVYIFLSYMRIFSSFKWFSLWWFHRRSWQMLFNSSLRWFFKFMCCFFDGYHQCATYYTSHYHRKHERPRDEKQSFSIWMLWMKRNRWLICPFHIDTDFQFEHNSGWIQMSKWILFTWALDNGLTCAARVIRIKVTWKNVYLIIYYDKQPKKKCDNKFHFFFSFFIVPKS